MRYSDFGQPSFCAVLEGSCRLAVDGERVVTLEAGDFVLLPATPGFTLSGFEPVRPELASTRRRCSRRRPKSATAREAAGPDVRLLGGYFVFDSPDAGLLVSLLPALDARARRRAALDAGAARRRGSKRAARSGRDLVLARLVEVLLIEALRSTARRRRASGLLRGLGRCAAGAGDPADARQLRAVVDGGAVREERRRSRARRSSSASPAPWACRRWNTCSPGAWRWRKDLLRRHELGLAEVAERVGYGSASTFSTAFSRHVGQPPGQYARALVS